MAFLLDVIVLSLKLLISIGDLVLFLAKVIKRAVKKIYAKVKTLAGSAKFGFYEKRERKSRTLRKIRHKEIKIFPLPFSKKIKYFTFGTLFSLFFIFTPLLVIIFLDELPNPSTLAIQQSPQTTKIYDRNGQLLFQIYAAQNRTYIPLSGVPKDLQMATVAIEDKNFYTNPGFDIQAIIRATISDLQGNHLQGGSTITQQLIKSTLLSPERSIKRKVKELTLALWAERLYSKEKILEMYFNQVPYGGTAWGVEAAAQTYFGKSVKDLDLAQSAFLAGLPKAPTTYSPYGTSASLWKKRQKDVLKRMQEEGFITNKQRDQALGQELSFNPPRNPIQAPHFVMYVRDLLVEKYGLEMVEKGGLRVKTTIDLGFQDRAQAIVSEEVQKAAGLNVGNGAALVTNPKTGEILAMVGSKDYKDPNGGAVNLTTALRQPGSSIKVVTYGSALSNGFTAATILDDSPVSFSSPGSPVYAPVNYDGGFHGRVSLRIALANSYNVPAVKTLSRIGIENMVDLAKKMGINTWKEPENYGLSITLGAAEVRMTDMAQVYGVLANEGKRVDLNPIVEITDSQGNIVEKNQNKAVNVLDQGVAFILSNILSDNAARAQAFGPNSILNITGHTVSVKTGTSDNKRDNWAFGYTPSYVVASWVGNNDNSPMSQNLASGITGAAPIWNRLMSILLSKKPDERPNLPSDIVQKPCIGRLEYFVKGTENLVNCNFVPNPSPTTTALR
ncbi:MAG: penicillin-binding protein [Candidatus Levybacteria bacterium]|nr:penicillin-binding protein [Candidatus Levybacteria bacterium]